MPVDEGRYAELFRALDCPPDAASMDWSSGLLSVGRAFDSIDSFKGMLNAPVKTPADQELLKTVTHETFHFFQVVTMGWVYRWACRQFDLVDEGIRQALDGEDPRTMTGLFHTIHRRLPAETPHAAAELDGELRERGVNSLSVADLVESQAFHVECRQHYANLDAARLFGLLQKAPARTYRRAYDVARYRLGDPRAFDCFAAIVSLSLCMLDPVATFDLLLDEAASALPAEPEEVLEMAQQLLPAARFLGSSVEVREAESVSHPIYDKAIREINDVLCPAGFSVTRFFLHPHDEFEHLVGLTRPIVFAADRRGKRLVHVPQAMNENEFWRLTSLAATFSTAMAEGRPSEADAHDPVAWVELLEPQLVQYTIPPEGRATGDSAYLKAFKDGLASDKHQALAARWGRTLLTFDDLQVDYAWTAEDVRTFIRNVHAAMPAFPLLLCLERDLGMAAVWLGSLADRAALHGAAVDIGHRSLVPRMTETLEAMLQLGARRGWDMRLPVAQFLSIQRRETRHAMLEALELGAPRA